MHDLLLPVSRLALEPSSQVSCVLSVAGQLVVATTRAQLLVYNQHSGSANNNKDLPQDKGGAKVNGKVNGSTNGDAAGPAGTVGTASTDSGSARALKWGSMLPQLDSSHVLLKSVSLAELAGASIETLQYLKELDYLFVHGNQYIHVYNFTTMEFVTRIEQSKNATVSRVFSQLDTFYANKDDSMDENSFTDEISVQNKLQQLDSYSMYKNFEEHDPFSFDSKSSVRSGNDSTHCFLAFAVKRKLFICSWSLGDAKLYKITENVLNDRVRNLEFLSSTKILVALTTEFLVVDIQTLHSMPLIVPSYSTKSFMIGNPFSAFGNTQIDLVKLSNSRILISKGNISCKVNNQGELLNKSIIIWPKIPHRVDFLFPYLIILHKNAIELCDSKKGTHLQTVDLDFDFKTFVCAASRTLFVFSGSTIYQISTQSYESQLSNLESSGFLDEAINVANQLSASDYPEKDVKYRQLQLQRAEKLFEGGKFKESLLLFSSFSAPPRKVLSYFPQYLSNIDLDPESKSLSPFADLSPLEAINNDRFMHALSHLLPYLADTRRKIEKINDQISIAYQQLEEVFGNLKEAARLVDTTLFNCYLIVSPGLIGPLVRVHNSCDVDIVEKSLTEKKAYKELVDFYYGKKLHEKALKLLQKLGQEKANACSEDQELLHESNGSELISNESEHIVQYLAKLDQENLDLIFEFIKWPMKVNPELAMSVFLADSKEAESLNKNSIIEFLLANFDTVYCIKYLEYVIDSLQVTAPSLHTKYIELMLSKAMENTTDYDKLVVFLKSTNCYEPRKSLKLIAKYDTVDKEKSDFFKTFVYKRLGDSDKVLYLLVHDLKYYSHASDYCWEMYQKIEAETGKFENEPSLTHREDKKAELFEKLIKMLLSPPVSNYAEALKVLNKYGSKLFFLNILDLLPDKSRCQDLSFFLRTQLRTTEIALFDSAMKSSLAKVELVKKQESLLKLKSKSIVIEENRLCGLCGKKLGHSVLSAFPNGEIYHYGCKN